MLIIAIVFQRCYLAKLEISNPGAVPRLFHVTGVGEPLSSCSPVWPMDQQHRHAL